MPSFCAHCAAPLEPDARFCAACSMPVVAIAGVLANELKLGIQTGVRSIVAAPSMKVPAPVLAGTIQIFWMLGQLLTVLPLGAALVIGSAMSSGSALLGGGGGAGEKMLAWSYGALVVSLAALAVDIALIYGLFTLKRWAYALFMWSMPILTGAALLLKLAMPASGETLMDSTTSTLGLSLLAWLAAALALALLFVQFRLVRQAHDELVN